MTGMDQITHVRYTSIVIFGPTTSTLFKCDESQPKYTHVVTWAGVGLLIGVTPRLYQGHLEVTKRSI